MSDQPMTGREFRRSVGTDLDRWTDAMAESAERQGHPVEREWLHGWLQDLLDAAKLATPPLFVDKED